MNKHKLHMKNFLFLVSVFVSFSLFGQKVAPKNWFNLDPKTDKVYGVSTERTYNELLKNKEAKPVIVAVIDGGTEVQHEDLKEVIWVNSDEIPNNGMDDDHNGYVDDVYGWNFIGGYKKNIDQDNLEVTRLLRTYQAKYEDADTVNLDGVEKENYYFYLKLKKKHAEGFADYNKFLPFYQSIQRGLLTMLNHYAKDSITIKELDAYQYTDKDDGMAFMILKSSPKKEKYINLRKLKEDIDEGANHAAKAVEYHYNLNFDPRVSIVGDNYDNPNERYYGNNKVTEPNGEHGTHVAGIIAAKRNDTIGMNGVASHVKIMVLRVVPDGDERDKDVANAIRYAVDNGASIINMSFGKGFSPNKSVVDEAVKYALSKDVLLVHAAGNDNKDTDKEDNFPNDKMDGYDASNWIEVGASSWKKGKEITAAFSNYGKTNVDVFAPGVDIYSCIPESDYASYNGTSMAAPVTAGVAAVLRSYYPHLTASQVKEIILLSSVKIKHKVNVPGKKAKTKLSELCVSGGIVNLYEAVKLAELKYGKK